MTRADDVASWLATASEEVWLMEPHRLTTFLGSLGSDSLARAAFRGSTTDDLPFEVRDGVAHIVVSGVLLSRVPWWMGGATSTPRLAAAVDVAARDSRVRSILLRVSSPGGSVSGIGALADALYDARARKRIHTHAQDMIGSAAYWLGSQAHRLTAEPTAEVGSIGAYRALVDSSAAFEREGLKVHLLRSGEHKGVGHPGIAITAEQLAKQQELIDGLCSLFVGAVARGRGADRAAIEPLATGATWLAADAARLGLIDGVEHAEAAHTAITVAGGDGLPPTRLASHPAEAPASAEEVDTMSTSKTPAAAAATTAPAPTTTTTPAAAAETTPVAAAVQPSARERQLETELETERAKSAALEAQMVEIHKARKTEALDGAVAAGRVAPAALEAFRKVADTQPHTDAGVTAFRAMVDSLPQVTRPTPQATVKVDDRDDAADHGGMLAPSTFSATEIEHLKANGRDPERVARSKTVRVMRGDGTAELTNGKVVKLTDYLDTSKPVAP